MTSQEWLQDLLREIGHDGKGNTPQQYVDSVSELIVRAALEEVGRMPNNVVQFPK